MSEEQLYDLAQLNEVAAGSQDFVNKMVDMFLDMTPGLVERVENGLLANDFDEVKEAAHKMKPTIDMMGIKSLHSVVREIEGNAKNRVSLEDLPDKVNTLKTVLEQVYTQLRNR